MDIRSKLLNLLLLGSICIFNLCNGLGNEVEEEGSVELYKIEGKVFRPDSSLVSQAEWFANTKVFTNTGHIGFLR